MKGETKGTPNPILKCCKVKLRTSQRKEFNINNEGLQKAVDSLENLCLSCSHHKVDCEHFIKTSIEMVDGIVTKCDDYNPSVKSR